MAKGFAIHNAPTDHGGFIPASQMRSSQMGNLFVVAGDGHFCPKCKCWSTVIKSHDHVLFDGKAVAYVGDLLTCGARIQPQQSHVVGDSGGISLRSSSSAFKPSSTQNNLNNSLVDNKKPDKAYYKWWWGASTYKDPKTNEQQNNSFLKNFNDLHNEYAYSENAITYEIDPKAWESEVAFEELLPIIQASAEVSSNTLYKALSELEDGQSRDVIIERVGVGGDYIKIAQSKHWPHGRLSTTLNGTVTRLGIGIHGYDFQFKGHAVISEDVYSWVEDAKGYKNIMIMTMGATLILFKGTKQPASVYNPNINGDVGLPTKYTRHYYFDYYKKGVNPPKYGNN